MRVLAEGDHGRLSIIEIEIDVAIVWEIVISYLRFVSRLLPELTRFLFLAGSPVTKVEARLEPHP